MSLQNVAPGLAPYGNPNDGLYEEVGNDSFKGTYTDAASMPIRTQMDEILYAIATPFDSYAMATDAVAQPYILSIAPDISSNTVSVYRGTQGAISGLKYCYRIIGRLYATA